MEMKLKDIMNELGGAFAVTWLIMGVTLIGDDGFAGDITGLAMTSLGGMLALGIAWKAFDGADILPPITWMKAVTSDDLTDQNMWTSTIIRLITQVVGAILAIILMINTIPEGSEMWTYAMENTEAQAAWSFALWSVVGMIAAGAILGQVSAKAGNDWAMPIAVMALAGFVNFESAADMASMLMNGTGDALAVAIPWLVDGVCIGVGALMGMKIDGFIADMDSDDSSSE
jgi:hypothetical protein